MNRCLTLAARLTAAALSTLLMAGAPTAQSVRVVLLKIVVVEGEDAVNVIQQRTAVAPVVEVRDRNDHPVAGAVVIFAVNRRAAFGEPPSTSVTVTTDAAGRAQADGLVPLRPGAIDIRVSATYEGETATATIHQRNVASVADAVTTRDAGGSAAGGSLSAQTLGVLVGGGSAGTVLGLRTLSGDDDDPDSPQPAVPITMTGTFSGTQTFTVTPPGCAVTAASSGDMTITIRSQTGNVINATGTFVRDLANPSAPCGGFGVTVGRTQFTLGDFSGARDRVDFQQTSSGNNGTSAATTTYSFVGQWTGTEMIGTLTFQSVTTFLATGVVVSGSFSVPVALR